MSTDNNIYYTLCIKNLILVCISLNLVLETRNALLLNRVNL